MQPIYARGNEKTRHNLLRWQRQAQTDKAPRVVLRLQAIRLSLQGRTAPQIAHLLGRHFGGGVNWTAGRRMTLAHASGWFTKV